MPDIESSYNDLAFTAEVRVSRFDYITMNGDV
jgi:hypothetical protein